MAELLLKCGLDARRASHQPFGVRWHEDIKYFANGSELATVFDVGANVGQTALKISRHFPESRIYAFEPVPGAYNELAKNTSGKKRIEPIPCALGSSCGTVPMTARSQAENNTILVDSSYRETGGPLVDVRVDTIDSFCANRTIDRINLLKIDVEGYEVNVLKGAEKFLAGGRVDFILAECDFFRRPGERHGDFAEILNHLTIYNYNVVAFYSSGVDDLGWIWGDVLFRLTTGSKAGRAACSPRQKPIIVGQMDKSRS